MDWDDLFFDEIIVCWERWCIELLLLEKVKFNCCVKLFGFGSLVEVEVYSFLNVSELGIG